MDILETIFSPEQIKRNTELKEYTYTKMGGSADIALFPNTYEQAAWAISFAKKENIPLTILGNGSNVIIKDGGIRGIVLILTNLCEISVDGNKITAGSGAKIIDVSRMALEHSLTGLEFACGIPGTVGGALYMNAGAYGGETKNVLESALVADREGNITKLNTEELDLEYRTSNIERKGLLVLEATFILQPGKYEEIKEKMDDLTHQRESKQPLEYPSCGSVFKRPPGYFAGKLIQDSHLQGVSIGDAEVSKKHAGFIVNKKNASAKDYISLIEHVQKTVKENFGVDLEREVRIIGED
ncbi:UDP-N-acetylmuramate dehydrogenase [Neobacillus notoginsengisoli]|uniref:UDP-N-acetylenolpyruvoylglucosamine reductase n=1 Tax=Neobacillus notoginsengisoli TaxID=1578198 RepID=A0A417YT22_9BACI|nr:UDP-N-acetylmuramate dehydrogenase [Neobacillus notoginsengisoli]RHW39110.1 UDP-N-acetylmuramate dehydrogenase [Neobacillus notoginsengisoli]